MTRKLAFSIFLSIIVLSLAAVPSQAESTGWSWGPFKSTTTTRPVGVQAVEPAGVKMPDFIGGFKKTTHSVTTSTKKMWKSASRTTKDTWNKTKNGFVHFFSTDNSRQEKPSTISDFLNQERPQ